LFSHVFSEEDFIHMFVDARRLDDGSVIEAEVCIIGGGIAGIALALEFGKRGIRTCVLESGGFRPNRATRDLYRGENIGLPYRFADGCRSRFLGGSSNCWGGDCRPMDEHDFLSRDWVPYSGWPFAKSELLPYYDRSREILRIGPNRFDAGFWVEAIARADVRRIPFVTDEVLDGISQFSPPLRFGQFYSNDLSKSKDVTVFLHANAVDIETDADGGKVQAIKLATLTGRTAKVTAAVFVLATGGIENARLLLVSNKNQPAGLGNHNDLVGRFFMDHPRLRSGQLRLRARWAHNRLYNLTYNYHSKAVSAYNTCIAAHLSLAPRVQAREKLLNAIVRLVSIYSGEETEAENSLIRIKHRVKQKAPPDWSLRRDLLTLVAHPLDSAGYVAARYLRPRLLARGCRFVAIVEPVPDPESRVTLSDQRDQLGMNRVRVRWRLDPLVKRTFDRSFALIAQELSRVGVADVLLDPTIEGGEWPDTFQQEGTWHHMGTTRMHDSPKLGVVDRHCRVHGIKNLYVSGSSVFPTASGIFPTITIVALALRLSDHIAKQVCRPVALHSGKEREDRNLQPPAG
jgi:choline dehydrogenase-like flavoprotein